LSNIETSVNIAANENPLLVRSLAIGIARTLGGRKWERKATSASQELSARTPRSEMRSDKSSN
jgi:hypothetical protein